MGAKKILTWLRGPEGTNFYLYRDKSDEYEIFGGNVIGSNGHALFSPDLKWLLTDRSVNKQNERTLVIADVDGRRCYDIGRFFSMPELAGPLRCDLHARWNRDGTAICFDSTHEGSRQMYVVDVSPLVCA